MSMVPVYELRMTTFADVVSVDLKFQFHVTDKISRPVTLTIYRSGPRHQKSKHVRGADLNEYNAWNVQHVSRMPHKRLPRVIKR
jgi:ribosomal protein S13